MQEKVHEAYMQRCLHLAKLAAGSVAPNPMVGAVLVYDDKIIGEGYHQKYGEPHAEVHCINDALKKNPDKISAATLYVSLEPCAHYGKTPPCSDLIIQHHIPKVVIACKDTFKEVAGKGIDKLRNAGVEVTVGVCENEAIALNKAFFCFHKNQRPYIVLKWAQTANGYIASNQSNRLLISNDFSNRLVHRWRSELDAIMIGANTAILDNPLLDNRNWFGRYPKKILFDPNLKVPTSLNLFKGDDVVLIFNFIKDAVAQNKMYLKMDKSNLLKEVLTQLYNLNIQSLLIEGGQKLLQSFINADVWDEARVITNKDLYIHSGLAAPQLINQEKISTICLDKDEIVYFKNKNNSYIEAATGLF